jgi:DNA-binding transcriptional regulator YiaG
MFNYSPFHKKETQKQESDIMALPIKERRKKLGLTQKGLASKLGVSLPSVVNWENGKIAPRGKNLAKIEKFLASQTSVSKKVAAKTKKKPGRPKSKVGRPKKAVTTTSPKKRGRPKKVVTTTSPKKRGRPKKVVTTTSPKKRGRPKGKVLNPKKGRSVSRQLSGVAKDLGFSNVDDMVKTIVRKHKIGKLDL